MELSPTAPAGKPSLTSSRMMDTRYRWCSTPRPLTPMIRSIQRRPSTPWTDHSYGGSVITEAGNHPKVAALVYIAAFALDEGESCASIEQALPQASKAFTPDSNGNWWIEQEHFAADFAADIPKDRAAFMAVSQVPISTEAFTHQVTKPAWKTKPTWYMVATADRSINPDQERMMAKRANAKTVEVNSSHVAYMSHPKESAKLIEEAATSASATAAA
jgi:pimeloyl-ACP methyl ester carboxylesterase